MEFEKEIDKLINEHEGGYVNNPADKGGSTKYGITQKTLTHWRGREVGIDGVKSLKKSEAKEIYYAWYYINPGINMLPAAIQPIMFDMAANHSPALAITILQEALLGYGFRTGKIDGKLGTKTIGACSDAIEALGLKRLITVLVKRRVIFYENIVRANESQRQFLGGWIARAESFLPAETTA